MRICFLAAEDSIHTKHWADYFIGRGDDVCILTFHPGRQSYSNTYHLRTYFRKAKTKGGNWQYLLSLKKICRILRKIKPDIVNAHYLTSYGLLAALSGFHPLVITVHGSDIKITPQKNFIYHKLAKFSLTRADLIFSAARHITEDIYKYGIARQKIVTVQYGICPDIFNIEGRSSSPYELITTRRLETVSNYQAVLEAMAIIKSKRLQTKLLIIGSGTLKNHLCSYAAVLGLEENVTFLGEVRQEEVARRLKQSRLFISVTHSDGAPLSLLEAMACGTVPIVSDIPANREWIFEGENGFFADRDNPQNIAETVLSVLGLDNNMFDEIARKNTELIAQRAFYNNNMAIIAEYFDRLTRLFINSKQYRVRGFKNNKRLSTTGIQSP
ncbi:MAG: glycosyltransferase family 4 protein [Candidatus Omnitrophota bacterium]